MQKDINTNDHVCIQTGKHATHNGWVIDIRDKIAKVMLDEDLQPFVRATTVNVSRSYQSRENFT